MTGMQSRHSAANTTKAHEVMTQIVEQLQNIWKRAASISFLVTYRWAESLLGRIWAVGTCWAALEGRCPISRAAVACQRSHDSSPQHALSPCHLQVRLDSQLQTVVSSADAPLDTALRNGTMSCPCTFQTRSV